MYVIFFCIVVLVPEQESENEKHETWRIPHPFPSLSLPPPPPLRPLSFFFFFLLPLILLSTSFVQKRLEVSIQGKYLLVLTDPHASLGVLSNSLFKEICLSL